MTKFLNYKGVKVKAFGVPVIYSNKQDTLKSKSSQRRYSDYRHFNFNYPITASKDLIVMYDVPSNKRSDRDWLRYQLGKFGYSMIQKSVWAGPSPLPKDFLRYVKKIGLFKKLKILKLAKPYSSDNRGM